MQKREYPKEWKPKVQKIDRTVNEHGVARPKAQSGDQKLTKLLLGQSGEAREIRFPSADFDPLQRFDDATGQNML